MRSEPHAYGRMVRPGLGAVGVLLWVMGAWCLAHSPRTKPPEAARTAALGAREVIDPLPAAIGNASLSLQVAPRASLIAPEAIALDMPDQPLPGQQRGPCRRLGEVEINGGCWGLAKREPPCEDKTYEWKGACYWPVSARSRPPTSKKPG